MSIRTHVVPHSDCRLCFCKFFCFHPSEPDHIFPMPPVRGRVASRRLGESESTAVARKEEEAPAPASTLGSGHWEQEMEDIIGGASTATPSPQPQALPGPCCCVHVCAASFGASANPAPT